MTTSGKIVRVGLPLLAAGLFAFAVVHVARASEQDGDGEPPIEPPRSPYERTVAGAGLVESRHENVPIGAEVPGIVAEVLVTEGDAVADGTPLFRLDERRAAAELAVRQAQLQTAETELDRLRAQPRPERLPLLEATVRRAEAVLAETEHAYRRAEQLLAEDALSEAVLEDRRRARDVARAQLARAEADLALAQAGAWQAEIAIADAARAEAAAAVRQARTRLELHTVRARDAGRVLRVDLEPGQFVAAPPAEPLLLLGDAERLQVRVDIDEYDIPRFRTGAPATGRLKGHPELTFALRFVRVEPYVVPKRSLTGRNTERVDTRVLQVIYAVEPEPDAPQLYTGQQVDVFVQAGDPDDDGDAARGR